MTLKVHHLNCATMCPLCERLLRGRGSWLKPTRFVCHCLLLETDTGLVLVDSGLGRDDVRDANRTLGRGFVTLMRPRLDMAETAYEQVKALGFSPDDVQHIVPTHLDLDHAGGLRDFPKARVHVLQSEYAQVLNPDWREAMRFRAVHFEHRPDWVRYTAATDQWFGLDAIRLLPELGIELYLIPLRGHTRGHCGVAVRVSEDSETSTGQWLLHCGDAYFHVNQIHDPANVPVGILAFEKLVQTIPAQRAESLRKLVQLARAHGQHIRLFSAHDASEFDALTL